MRKSKDTVLLVHHQDLGNRQMLALSEAIAMSNYCQSYHRPLFTPNVKVDVCCISATKLGVFLPLPADYAIPVSLCFEPESAPQVCWQVEFLGPPELPPQLNVSCDIENENVCTFLDPKPIAYRVFHDP